MKNPIAGNGAFFAIGGFAAALFLAGAAHAITDTVFKYSSPKTGYYSIGPMAMGQNGNINYADYPIQYQNGSLSAESGDCFSAGVHLPDGATMTDLTVWYAAPTQATKITVYLMRTNPATGGFDNIVFKALPVSNIRAGRSNHIPAAAAVVDNSQYVYGFGLCLSSIDNSFFGARVTYTYTNAGD